jgi:erythritol transport system permease protein
MTTTAPLVAKRRKPAWLDDGLGLRILFEGRAFIALIVIIIVFSALSPNYLTVQNVSVMAGHVATNAILAIGMLMVILNSGIDLSVGSTVGLTGVVAGYLLQGVHVPFWNAMAYPSVWVVILCALVVGGVVGWINGMLVSRFKVAPFVATLGTLYAVRGAALLITNGLTYPQLQGSPALGNTGFNWLGFQSLLGVPIGVLFMAILAAIGSVLLNRTAFGRWLYASGGNERAAELSGIPVKKVKLSVYVISGVCAGVVGLIIASELTSATPQTGQSFELTAIAAVVIGGASLQGGKGNIRGTLLGAFVIGFLSDGLVIIGVSQYWQTVLQGAVIVLAVMLNAIEFRAKRAKASSLAPVREPAASNISGPDVVVGAVQGKSDG